MPLRDTISPIEFDKIEFDKILNGVKGRMYRQERRKIALTLLYLTGLRVLNLLLLKVQHIKEFLENGQTLISLIKGGEQRHRLTLSSQGKKVSLHVGEEFIILI